MSSIVTANLLATGRVVFLAADGAWVATLAEAVVYGDAAAAEAGLAAAQRREERPVVVEPFIIGTDAKAEGRPAMTLRDTIRANGPTIRFQPKAFTGA